MGNIIKKLPPLVANQIAAGEVVQRPASVVKELLENSLDAGAACVKLYLKEGGRNLIQVVDDGVGMSKEDCLLCFERHATSKISKATDLYALHTKGFRGEAMASIASVAHVCLKSKQANSETGHEVIIEGGKIQKTNEVVTNKGTSISVKNLFFNIPARRQFLKSNNVEFKHIIQEFYRVAIPHEDIEFELYHNDRLEYQLKAQNTKQRIGSLFGHEKNERFFTIEEQNDSVSIEGLIGRPTYAKKQRGEQFIFVNNRFIKSNYLNHAVKKAFEGLIEDDRYPSFFLFLIIDPKRIEVNIHPTKTEIKFEDDQLIYSVIKSCIKHSLGQFQVVSALDFQKNPDFEVPASIENKPAQAPKMGIDPNYNPFKKEGPHFKISYTKQDTQREQNNKNYWESLYQNDADNEVSEPSKEDQKLFSFKKSEVIEEPINLQVANKYILCAIKSGMVIINQHLAHRRILYEELKKRENFENKSQILMFPIKLHVDIATKAIINAMKSELRFIGFIIESLTPKEEKEEERHQLIVKGVPSIVKDHQVEEILNSLENPNESSEINTKIHDELYKTIAQKAAIKTGHSLLKEERKDLINQLFSCGENQLCPFGKKIFKIVKRDELDFIFNQQKL